MYVFGLREETTWREATQAQGEHANATPSSRFKPRLAVSKS